MQRSRADSDVLMALASSKRWPAAPDCNHNNVHRSQETTRPTRLNQKGQGAEQAMHLLDSFGAGKIHQMALKRSKLR